MKTPETILAEEKTRKQREKRRTIARSKPRYPALKALMRDVDRFLSLWGKSAADEEDLEVADFIERLVQWGNQNDGQEKAE